MNASKQEIKKGSGPRDQTETLVAQLERFYYVLRDDIAGEYNKSVIIKKQQEETRARG